MIFHSLLHEGYKCHSFIANIWWQEVIVGPDNRTATSSDNFLRVNLVGDYVGYTDIPSFDDLYLVIPRQVALVTHFTLELFNKFEILYRSHVDTKLTCTFLNCFTAKK